MPGHHPDPEIEGGGNLIIIFFRPFGPHFGLRIRRGGGASPGSGTDVQVLLQKEELLSTFCNKISQLTTTWRFFARHTTWQFNSFRRRLFKSPVIFFSWLVILRNLIQARFARFWELMRGWLVASQVLQQLYVFVPRFQRTLSHS